jgi:hypothetical protein
MAETAAESRSDHGKLFQPIMWAPVSIGVCLPSPRTVIHQSLSETLPSGRAVNGRPNWSRITEPRLSPWDPIGSPRAFLVLEDSGGGEGSIRWSLHISCDPSSGAGATHITVNERLNRCLFAEGLIVPSPRSENAHSAVMPLHDERVRDAFTLPRPFHS